MEETPVTVLRLGHRPGRDDRMTTHVGLTARALGADRAVFEPDATDAVETVRNVTDRFGGPFEADVADSPTSRLRDWDGPVAHLTMYGRPVEDCVDDVRADVSRDDADDRVDSEVDPPATGTGEPVDGLLIVVGAEKVPFEVYERADYNVAVTNQPHSEVAALAVFLDRLFEGAELDRTWVGADRRVVPTETGKRVIDVSDDEDDESGDDEEGYDDESGDDNGTDQNVSQPDRDDDTTPDTGEGSRS